MNIEKIRIRSAMRVIMDALKKDYSERRDKTSLIELDMIRRRSDELMFQIYSPDNVEQAFNYLGDDQEIIVNEVVIKRTQNFVVFSDALAYKPVEKIKTEIKIEIKSDDEMVYNFILENQTNGIESTKKFIESMFSGKISRARIGDTLTRLIMVGFNGKKVILTDAEDLTKTDKVFKVQD